MADFFSFSCKKTVIPKMKCVYGFTEGSRKRCIFKIAAADELWFWHLVFKTISLNVLQYSNRTGICVCVHVCVIKAVGREEFPVPFK